MLCRVLGGRIEIELVQQKSGFLPNESASPNVRQSTQLETISNESIVMN